VSLLDVPQIFTLLKAVEDMATVHERVREICEEFMAATVQACAGSGAGSSFASVDNSQGRATRSRTNGHPPKLDKNISNMTASSGFSLVGSSLMHSSTHSLSSFAFTGSSGVTVGSSGGSSATHSLQSSGFLVMPTMTVSADAASQVSRGWDWRVAASKMGSFSGDEVIRMLRVSLSNELARAWIAEL